MQPPVSGLTEYELCDIGEGKMALYAQTDEEGVLVRTGVRVPDAVVLPEGTSVIAQNACYGATSESGSFTVNWEELPVWLIQAGAFENSQLGGTVTIDQEGTDIPVQIGDHAFAGCSSMEQFVTKGQILYVGWDSFSDCSSLTHVEFSDLTTWNTDLPAGIFTGCDTLSELVFTDAEPPKMLLYGSLGYEFNYNWTKEEETEQLRIRIPDGAEEAYIKAWRYLFTGASGGITGSEYLDLWYEVQMELMDWETWQVPADETVTAEVKNRLLTEENRLREMFGLDAAAEPAGLYSYTESGGILTLTGVPADLTKTDLSGETMDMPEGWYLDYIGSSAFSDAVSLEEVSVTENMSGIYTDAFDGVQSDGLTLTFEAEKPPALLGMSKDSPFTFGVEDERLRIVVPKGTKEAYMEAWMYPFAGYTDETDMYLDVGMELIESLGDAEPEEVKAEMENRLAPLRERLDTLITEAE